MVSRKTLRVVVLLGLFSLWTSVPIQARNMGPRVVRLTWMSITNWLFEVGNTRIVMDGYITRIPASAFAPVFDTGEFSVPDSAGIQRVIEALGGNKKVDFILTGHSHFDHSFDTAEWAKLTGAHIIGARSTCLQAFAQGIPDTQCTIVEGGEVLDLGSGVTVHVVRWNHSGDPSGTFGRYLQTPLELVNVPIPDPVTGGLGPGILQDFPQGGGARAYLFTVENPGGRLSWFYSNTGNAATFAQPVIVDEAEFESFALPFTKSPPLLANLEIAPQETSAREHLIAAMTEAGLDHVDLWLGFSEASHVAQVVSLIRPDAYIPHHWDGLFFPFFDGLPLPFSNPEVEELLDDEGVTFLPQRQYMDKYKLGANGITPMPNHHIKQKLGFPDVQEFE